MKKNYKFRIREIKLEGGKTLYTPQVKVSVFSFLSFSVYPYNWDNVSNHKKNFKKAYTKLEKWRKSNIEISRNVIDLKPHPYFVM